MELETPERRAEIANFDAAIVKWGPFFQYEDVATGDIAGKPFDHALEDLMQLYADAGCDWNEIDGGLRVARGNNPARKATP